MREASPLETRPAEPELDHAQQAQLDATLVQLRAAVQLAAPLASPGGVQAIAAHPKVDA